MFPVKRFSNSGLCIKSFFDWFFNSIILGITIDTGKNFSADEDRIIQKNMNRFLEQNPGVKMEWLLGFGVLPKDKERRSFISATHFYQRLGNSFTYGNLFLHILTLYSSWIAHPISCYGKASSSQSLSQVLRHQIP